MSPWRFTVGVLLVSLSAFAQDSTQFVLSADPDRVIFELGTSRGLTTYAVHGDGRVVEKGRQHRHEAVLSFEELQELFGILEEHQLLDFDEGDLYRRLSDRMGGDKDPREVISDGTYTIVTFSLERYTDARGTVGPLERTIRCFAPGVYFTHYPDIIELEGCVKLYRWARALEDRPDYREVAEDRP